MRPFLFLFLVLTASQFSYGQKILEDNERFMRAVDHMAKQEFAAAADTFTLLLENQPLPAAHYNRGMCYYMTGEKQKALEDYQIALTEFADDPNLHLLMASTYLDFSEYSRAARQFSQALKLGYIPNNEDAFHIGTSYFFIQQIDSAKKYLNLSLELNLESKKYRSWTYTNLGWIYLGEKDYPNAKRMFELSLQLNPDNPQYMNNLGLAYFRVGELDRGLSLVLRAKGEDPDNAFVYRNLALIYMAKGEQNLACEHYQRALDLKIVEEWGAQYVAELMNYCQ